jgi:hypothetical protein
MPRLGFQNTSQGNAFFINLTAFWARQHTLDASGNVVEVPGVKYWNSPGNSYAYPSGSVLLRDLGKTIRVPGQTLNAAYSGRLRTLRKVQLVGQANQVGFPVSNGFNGYNEGVSGAQDTSNAVLPSGYATFYIDLNNQNDYANVPKSRFARLSIQ